MLAEAFCWFHIRPAKVGVGSVAQTFRRRPEPAEKMQRVTRREVYLHVECVVAWALGEEIRVELGRCFELWRKIFLREDRLDRTLRHAGAAVDAGVGVDVVPRPLRFRLARDDAFYGTHFHACPIANA